MREIQLSPTQIGGSKNEPRYEDNEAIPVYDTSGPYGDPQAKLDVHNGLPKLRAAWVADRQDTEALASVSSGFTQQRLADEGLDHLRLSIYPATESSHWSMCDSVALRPTGENHARDGVYRPTGKYGP